MAPMRHRRIDVRVPEYLFDAFVKALNTEGLIISEIVKGGEFAFEVRETGIAVQEFPAREDDDWLPAFLRKQAE